MLPHIRLKYRNLPNFAKRTMKVPLVICVMYPGKRYFTFPGTFLAGFRPHPRRHYIP